MIRLRLPHLRWPSSQTVLDVGMVVGSLLGLGAMIAAHDWECILWPLLTLAWWWIARRVRRDLDRLTAQLPQPFIFPPPEGGQNL